MERNEKLLIKLYGPNNKTHFVEVRSVRQLLLPTQSIDYNSLSEQLPYLKGLPIKSYKDAVPSVLIGLNNIKLCTSNQIREGFCGGPIAICTRLGWCLCGNISETVGVSGNSKVLCKDDERAMEMLEKYTIKRPDDRYEAALLWRYDDITLPDSYNMAIRRLNSLEKVLRNDVELFNIFKRTLAEYLEKNYITNLEDCEKDAKKIWYLPIFPVFNKNKPNKTRIVWNAASKAHEEVSLNSLLLIGPDLLASLPAILFRFRQKQIAVTGDIEQNLCKERRS